MIIARVETRNFSFMAAGNDEAEALAALRAGWAQHVAEYGASPEMIEELIADDEVTLHSIEAGASLRDGEPLYPKENS